jgi:ribose transport system permease protein
VTGALRAAARLLPKSYLVLVLLVIILAGYIASPYFLTLRNASDVISFSAITSVLAVGQFFVIVTGGIDLSVGSIVALSTVIVSLLLKHGIPAAPAAVLALLACAGIGLINGVMVVYLRLAPFIATLATLSAALGLSYIIQSTSLIQITDGSFINFFSDGHLAGIPSPVVIFLLVMLGGAFVCKFTTFGRRLYAIGGNREAARLSGLPIGRDLLVTYTISGALAGLAGLLAAAQLLEGSSLIGQNYELDAIAAVVVGGASLAGGKGDPISAVIGGFIIEIIVNIMNIIGISSNPQLVIKGAVIVVAVFFSSAGGVSRLSAGMSKLFSRGRPGGDTMASRVDVSHSDN